MGIWIFRMGNWNRHDHVQTYLHSEVPTLSKTYLQSEVPTLSKTYLHSEVPTLSKTYLQSEVLTLSKIAGIYSLTVTLCQTNPVDLATDVFDRLCPPRKNRTIWSPQCVWQPKWDFLFVCTPEDVVKALEGVALIEASQRMKRDWIESVFSSRFTHYWTGKGSDRKIVTLINPSEKIIHNPSMKYTLSIIDWFV